MPYTISQKAAADLQAIYIYGATHFGIEKAEDYARTLVKRFTFLADNPGIGRLDARVTPAIRRHECMQHVIFYDVSDNQTIRIVLILHGATDYVYWLDLRE